MRMYKRKITEVLKKINSIVMKKTDGIFNPDITKIDNVINSGKYDIFMSITFMILLIIIAWKFHKEIGVFAISMSLFLGLALPFFCISLLRRFDKNYDKDIDKGEDD